jgi:hypothetical protein
MAKAVPYVCTSKFGEALLGGLKKVFTAVNAPVELTMVTAQKCPADATHVFAGPLTALATAQLCEKYGLSSKVTSAKASAWYPSTLYPTFPSVTVRNLYDQINPSFLQRPPPSPTASIVPKEPNELSLYEIQKESSRTIDNFFGNEARESLQDTLKVAISLAIAQKIGEKGTVTVVHKPQGEISTSTFDEMAKALSKSELDARADELRSNNVSLEMSAVGSAWPKMVMFPESLGYVVCPPTKTGLQMEQLLSGLGGGSGMVAQRLAGAKATSTVFTCANETTDENPAGALVAASELLSSLGFKDEAAKLLKGVEKAMTKAAPKGIPGGSASLDDFVDAVCQNCS